MSQSRQYYENFAATRKILYYIALGLFTISILLGIMFYPVPFKWRLISIPGVMAWFFIIMHDLALALSILLTTGMEIKGPVGLAIHLRLIFIVASDIFIFVAVIITPFHLDGAFPPVSFYTVIIVVIVSYLLIELAFAKTNNISEWLYGKFTVNKPKRNKK